MDVAVIGSFRPAEAGKFGLATRREAAFGPACRALAAAIVREGGTLVVAWSNDHLAAQHIDGRYRFEETADFHALEGALGASGGSGGAVVRLLVSGLMWTEGAGASGGTPLSETVVVDRSLGDWLRDGRIERVDVDADLLRSEMLDRVVVPGSRLLVAVGGGKATSYAVKEALARGSLLPLPHFGGTSAEAFARVLADTGGRHAETLRRLESLGVGVAPEGADLPAIYDAIGGSLSNVVSEARTVFLAMPFRDSVALDPEYRQREVKHAVRQALKEAGRGGPAIELRRIDEDREGLAADIPQRIQAEIRACSVFIAEVTELDSIEGPGVVRPNANVWWELGYATALGKPVIILAREGTPLPFNVRVRRFTLWENEDDITRQVASALRRHFRGRGG